MVERCQISPRVKSRIKRRIYKRLKRIKVLKVLIYNRKEPITRVLNLPIRRQKQPFLRGR